jgi:hypothetical protein
VREHIGPVEIVLLLAQGWDHTTVAEIAKGRGSIHTDRLSSA